MSDQYLGEIRAFGFNFAPSGWILCNGQLLSISQYAALFSLLGTYYGGNGTTNFGLPNLQGSVPMHWGTGSTGTTYDLGEMTGSPNVTIATNQLPLHNHLVQAAESLPLQAATPGPSTWLGYSSAARTYVNTATPNTTLSPSMIGPNSGGSIPHDNMQPFLTVNFCIAFTGAFPPRG